MIARPPTTTGGKLRLVGEILTSAARAKRVLRGNDVVGAIRVLRDDALVDPGHDMAVSDAAGFGYAVTRTLTVVRVRCLVQSLTLTAMLARRGMRSALVIGVRPGADFGAHAWVEVDGHPVLPPGAAEFARLVEL